MTDAELTNLKDPEKAAVIKRVLATKDGKKFRRILELHLSTHIPSALLADFEPNQMFYRDGQKSVFAVMDQALEGTWDTEKPDPMEEDDEPSEPL